MLDVLQDMLCESNNKANLSPAELAIINERQIKMKNDLGGMNTSNENKLSTGLLSCLHGSFSSSQIVFL